MEILDTITIYSCLPTLSKVLSIGDIWKISESAIYTIFTKGNVSVNFISVKDGPETDRKKSEMKEHKKTTWHMQKCTPDVG